MTTLTITHHVANPRVRLTALPLYLLLATDVVNGITAIVTPGAFNTIALLIKASVALVMALYCRWTVSSVVELLATFTVVGYALIIFGDSSDAITLALKTGSVVFLLLLLERYSERLDHASLVNFSIVSLVVIAISLILGLAGVGHTRYGDSTGSGMAANGFLVAGNEINVALVGIFWWLSAVRRRSRRASLSLLLYWLCLTLMVLSQSKTTIIAATITILYFNRRSKYALLLLAMLAPVLGYLLVTSATWDRWVFFYNAYAGEGILSALTGGRFGRVGDISIDLSALLISGAGILTATGGYIESDPLDLVVNFGAIGVVLYLLFAKRLYNSCKPALVAWTLVMITSLLAGHVVYSVFAAPIMFCCFRAASQLEARNSPSAGRTAPMQA